MHRRRRTQCHLKVASRAHQEQVNQSLAKRVASVVAPTRSRCARHVGYGAYAAFALFGTCNYRAVSDWLSQMIGQVVLVFVSSQQQFLIICSLRHMLVRLNPSKCAADSSFPAHSYPRNLAPDAARGIVSQDVMGQVKCTCAPGFRQVCLIYYTIT